MGEWLFFRRDRLKKARHEVPGVNEENSPVPAGRLNGSEYLAFLKRHQLSFDDKYLWN